jgi:hypothetical protein
MSIEVRNFFPSDESGSIPVYSDISFDLVVLDNYTIEITSLTISIETTSNIDTDTHTLSYAYGDDEIVVVPASSTCYKIRVNPSTPYDEGLNVTVLVNVEGTNENSDYYEMGEYSSRFSTNYNGLMSDFKYAFIHHAQEIPVHQEILRKNSTSAPKIYDSAYKLWNRTPTPRIRLNQVLINSDDTNYGYNINHETGEITFTSALSYNDTVDAEYTFSFFSDEEIESFFRQATSVWNVSPPYGGPQNIYYASQDLRGALMIGSSLFAFREMLYSLAFQQKRIIFDNASWGDGWVQVKDLIKNLHDLYKDDWEKLLKAKKARLPSIKNIIVPEFSMPGGRTVSAYNTVDIGFGQHVNFENLFNMMDEGKDVHVYSLSNGISSRCRVSAIEFEGMKEVYSIVVGSGSGLNLKTKTISTSLDHKYETSNGMKRLKNLYKGSKVVVSNNGIRDIWNIFEIGKLGTVPCYEIEVPDTGKFLCNDISVSNSRMFRYLYK